MQGSIPPRARLSAFRTGGLTAAALLALSALHAPAGADGIRPQRFGPFLQQSIAADGNPTGYARVFPFMGYNFQAGWMEPIAVLPWPLFRGSYLETQANATVSPYQTDFGIAFNLKPIRFLEFGMAYNRLFFPNTLAGFTAPDTSDFHVLPPKARWRPTRIFGVDHLTAAGADIFTYQANATLNTGPLQWHTGVSYGMWAVDTRTHDLILEYRTGLLIKRNDRIGNHVTQVLYRPDADMSLAGLTAGGFGVRNQFWWTVQTGLSQNLLSAGFSGLRIGRNLSKRYQGLEGWVGTWTWHPQLTDVEPWEKLHVMLRWTWNIQILDLTEQ